MNHENSMRLLLVEDDIPLARGLQKALRGQGYTVNHVETGEDAWHVMSCDCPDIVVMDIGLPDQDGIQILTRLRGENSTLPVLLLTARDSVDDRVRGLDSGADDYLVKPFDMTELLARLRVLERRLAVIRDPRIIIGVVAMDTLAHQVWKGEDLVELSRREYMLLKSLMENAGRIMTREVLESRLYDWSEEVCSNAIEVHIHHLRKKLGNTFIKTIRGVGYRVDRPLKLT